MRHFIFSLIIACTIALSFGPIAPASAQTDSPTPPTAYGVRWAGDSIGVNTNDGLWLFSASNLDLTPQHYLAGQNIPQMRFDPTGHYAALVVSSLNGQIVNVLDLTTGETLLEITPPMGAELGVGALAFDATGERLVVSSGHRIEMFNLTTLESEFTFSHPTAEWIMGVQFGTLYDTLIIAEESTLTIYRIEDLALSTEAEPILEYALPAEIKAFQVLAGSPVAFLIADDTLYELLLSSGDLLPLTESVPAITTFTVTTDGSSIIYSTFGLWAVFDITSQTLSAEYPLNDSSLYFRMFATDSTTVVGLQSDGKVLLWNIMNPAVVTELGSFAPYVIG